MSKPRTVEQLKSELRASGLRATTARVAVLRTLHQGAGPLSHAEVWQAVQKEGYDRATVYRNLIDLCDSGIAKRSDHGDHTWRFEHTSASHSEERGAHPHFVCSDCGTVECLPSESVAIQPLAGTKKIETSEVEIQLRGKCGECE